MSRHARQRRHRFESAWSDPFETLSAQRYRDRLFVHAHALSSQLSCHPRCPVDTIRLRVDRCDLPVKIPLRSGSRRESRLPTLLPCVVPGFCYVEQSGHPANRVVSLLRIHQFEFLLFRDLDAKKAAAFPGTRYLVSDRSSPASTGPVQLVRLRSTDPWIPHQRGVGLSRLSPRCPGTVHRHRFPSPLPRWTCRCRE